jgi:hypothetical protein
MDFDFENIARIDLVTERREFDFDGHIANRVSLRKKTSAVAVPATATIFST